MTQQRHRFYCAFCQRLWEADLNERAAEIASEWQLIYAFDVKRYGAVPVCCPDCRTTPRAVESVACSRSASRAPLKS